MDQNNKGTPNPLNQAPKAVGQTNQPAKVTPAPSTAPKPALASRPVPVAKPAPVAAPTPAPAPAPEADPMARPMEQAPAPEAKPVTGKKKTGLIIAGIVALFLAIGCGVAAALIFLNPGGDPVTAAMQKIISGESGSKLAVNGTISAYFNNEESSMLSNLGVAVDGKVDLSSKISSADLALTAKLNGNDEELSVNAEEISTASGELFFKLENLSEAIENYGKGMSTTEPSTQIIEDCDSEVEDDCIVDVVEEDEYVETDFSQYAVLFELFEDKWFKVTADDLSSDSASVDTSAMECMTNLFEDVKNSSNSLSGIYQDNPFISSSTENITVASRQNPVYRVIIDGDKLADFMSVAEDLPAMENYRTCAGLQKEELDTEAIKEAVAELPAIYVEVDGKHNFTRLYTVIVIDDLDATVTVDLNFSYPETVNVSEPAEYENFSEFMQNLSGAFSGASEAALESESTLTE